jgi:hypothetical protein
LTPSTAKIRFLAGLSELRRILYLYYDSDQGGSVDTIKEDVLQMCMNEIDDYLREKKDIDEM